MSKRTEFFFPASAGTHRIHAVEWLPENGVPRAVVQILHGVAEHIGRYEDLADYLTGQGFAVVGNDHPGHGQSAAPGDLGFFAAHGGWMHASNDTRTLQLMTARQFPGLPYFLLGHSMGSFLTRTYLIRFPGTVSGAVLCGTGDMSGALIAAGRAAASLEALRLGRQGKSPLLAQLSFGGYNRAFRPNRTEYDWLSANEENVDRYIADPLCGFPMTVGLFQDLMDGLDFIRREPNLRRMDKDTPVLFIAGAEDPVGDMGKGVRRVYLRFKKAGVRRADIRIYTGMRHEIFNETEHAQVYADLRRWLEAQIGGGAQ